MQSGLLGATAVLTGSLVILTIGAPVSAAQARPSTARPRPQRPASVQNTSTDPVAALNELMLAAESALQNEEPQIAESRYREALMQGWLLLGAMHVAERRLPEARDALRRASESAVDARVAQRALAMVMLQSGEQEQALRMLTQLASRAPQDAALRRLLAQALVSNGQPEQAVQELEEAHGLIPDDQELAFALASGYLRLKKVDEATALFESIIRARPHAGTYVLIGRTYRDFSRYALARTMLRRALELDPRARRAHYYLGTVAIMDEGYVHADEAIREFRAELALAPGDPVTHLRLGVVLEGVKRHADALRSLEIAAADPAAGREAFEYLGRCQLALGRTAEAVTNLSRALEMTTATDKQGAGTLHYQLALALRSLGREAEAAPHFLEAQRSAERRTDEDRARLGRYLADVPESEATSSESTAVLLGTDVFARFSQEGRAAFRQTITAALARAYLNLGIVQARANRFARAAEYFEGAAAADPDFPGVQYSLGVAYFNAGQFEKATAPLTRALATDAHRTEAQRMLALSWLNVEDYARAADLLQADPLRDTDASLQYAYGLALVRSGRSSEAEAIFSQLLAAHGDSPELNVLMGVAHAQQGDFGAAITSLKAALSHKPDVRDANATLGTIYLKQGKLDEAAAALTTELASYPDAISARHTLAAVLELQGRLDEAEAQLRTVLKSRPQFADARYLLGKILLSRGRAEEATDHLETAARLAPDDANVHFQLAQAYQKTGRAELARQEFERYRQLKDKSRGDSK